MEQAGKIIMIGGSWGGLHASLSILSGLKPTFPIPIVLVLHRLKNFESDLCGLFRKRLAINVLEIEEKEKVRPGNVYIAPSNYHVLIERDKTFSLDVSEYENFSRPSIDVTFSSAAEIFRAGTTGILLSGASKDGSKGLKKIRDMDGLCIVQDPEEAEVATMPASAIRLIPDSRIYTLKKIQAFLCSLQ